MPLRRTVAREVNASGVALHAGVAVSMRILPAAANSGVVFRRVDVSGAPEIPALWRHIADSRYATMLATNGASVGVTEHLLAALAGAEIDDCIVELDGPEPPFLDGDALSFLTLLDKAGLRQLDAPRESIRVLRAVRVEDKGASAELLPGDAAEFFFEIEFPNSPIGRQSFELRVDEASFRREIAPARTFGFLHQAEQLRAAGYARGATLDNTLVIDRDHLCNPEKQRFGDEFVRHKILDAIGDLKLAGAPIIGRFAGRRSSHALNAALLRSLFSEASNYRWSG